MKQRSTRQRRLLFSSRIFTIFAAIVLIVGGVVAWRQYQDNKKIEQAAAQATQTGQGGPSTKKPDQTAFNRHQVPSDMPRYIFIPKLSIQATVKPLGVTAKNQIASPSNIHDAGWYIGSAKPGQSGAVVIDGHVSSWTARGVFYDLKKLQPGDQIKIQRGDDQIFTYKVVKSQSYDAKKVDMNAALAPVTADKPGLNLITCDGSVIKGTNEFSRRIVVFTEQV